jgi:hypothetical protein
MLQKNIIPLFIALAAGFFTAQAHAVQRAHVSALAGSDANTATGCTVTAPCRFFQAAMSVVDTNGELVALDSGGYGAVNITKSLSIIAPSGVYAGISVFPGSDGVTIATPDLNVTLRGITINSQGGNNGINMSVAGTLSVENVAVTNFASATGSGIRVEAPARVNVTDSLLRNNAIGLYFSLGAIASVFKTTVLGGGVNANSGVYAIGSKERTTTTVSVNDCTVTGYPYAVASDGEGEGGFKTAASIITLSQNKLVNNSFAVRSGGNTGFVISNANNTFYPNSVSGSRSITVEPLR